MPVDVMDDNIWQSADWTRKAEPGHRYAFLGGVSFLKPQNPTYIDQTNTSLTTRAIDRRVANPDPRMFEVSEPADGASSRGEAARVDDKVEEKDKKHRHRRRRNCRAEGDDEETLNVCPNRPSFSAFFGEFASELGGTCRDVSLAISKKGDGTIVDGISDAIYQRRRPLYLGIVLLLVLFILICVVGMGCGKSCKK